MPVFYTPRHARPRLPGAWRTRRLPLLGSAVLALPLLLATAHPAPAAPAPVAPSPFEVGMLSSAAIFGERPQATQRPTVLRRKEPEVNAVLPVVGAYRITGRFADVSGLWSRAHTGLDFAAPSGTTISAIEAGTVTEAGWAGAYGYRTVVTTVRGTEYWYCHQSSVSVTTGQEIEAGQPIGQVGATGNVTGPHLHLEVRADAETPIDPDAALAALGLRP